jgi:hypothetical protein
LTELAKIAGPPALANLTASSEIRALVPERGGEHELEVAAGGGRAVVDLVSGGEHELEVAAGRSSSGVVDIAGFPDQIAGRGGGALCSLPPPAPSRTIDIGSSSQVPGKLPGSTSKVAVSPQFDEII